MTGNPYHSLPDHCFWKRSVALPEMADVDPVVSAKFVIRPRDRVATAGSCFAQHIARHLRLAGFSYFVTETANPVVDERVAERFGYGLFTARYGNIYTTRQLIQLLRRAYGEFAPVDDVWSRGDGRVIDPFRPQVQPDGFSSMAEFHADRRQHFAAVRRAVEELDIFVFTLGLTETWLHREDGAAYPLAPGVAGGTFDRRLHTFVNLSVFDVIHDLEAAIRTIQQRNAAARFILTVSPVPLIATYEDRSVLVSTTYSKSVLRVACEEVSARRTNVAYFPSYEIVSGTFNRGAYFADDLRSVREAGVSHAMRLFMKHYAGAGATPAQPAPAPATGQHAAEMAEIVAVMCDEEALERA